MISLAQNSLPKSLQNASRMKVSLSEDTVLRLLKSGQLVVADVQVEDPSTKQQLHDLLLCCL